MTLRTSSLPPESVAAISIGFVAGITSTVLTGWAQVSDLGRAIIFVGSCLSGALFTYWSARSSRAPRTSSPAPGAADRDLARW